MTSEVQVLVVGAGPTGLTAASELTRHGVRVRIVEQNQRPSIHSKALVIQPRTLEALFQMGIADRAVAAGQAVAAMQPHIHGKVLPAIEFGEVDGPFAKPVMLRQSQTEAILGERLGGQGVNIEWGVGLDHFEVQDAGDSGDRKVEVTLTSGERLRVDYLVGCDGAHSRVRKQLGVAFEGSTYPNDFIQVDCKVRWGLAPDRGQAFFRDDGALVCLPLGEGSFRFILIRRERPADAPEQPSLAEFQAVLDAEVEGPVELYDIEWIIRFHLHERLAAQFRVGPVFLAGDAAHIHTPAGGQGMNTGIQDACNLAWKLGLAVRGVAGERLLASYEAERRPIAAEVLRMSDRAFKSALGVDNNLILWLRGWILPIVLGSRAVQAKATRTAAQLEVNVRHSPIVRDARFLHPGPRAGDRAPDARFVHAGKDQRVLELLRGTEHLVFAHRAHTNVITALARALPEDLVRIIIADEGPELEQRYHLGRHSALWVVRPDGQIGFREAGDDPAPLLAWFAGVLARD